MKNLTPTEGRSLPDSSRRRVRNWVLAIIILCALVVFVPFFRHAIYVLLGKAFPDSPPPDDRHLVFSMISLPNEENAFYDLGRASSTLAGEQNEVSALLNSEVLDREHALRMLASNSEARVHFSKASMRNSYLVPDYADPKNIFSLMVYRGLASLKTVANVVALDARVQYESGNIEGSTERAFELVRVGALMESSPRPGLLEYLVGKYVKTMGLKRLLSVVEDPQVDREVKERIARDVEKYRDKGEGLAEAFRFEYALWISNLNSAWAVNGEIYDNYLMRPNATKGYYVEQTNQLISRIDIPCAQFSSTTEKRFVGEYMPKWLTVLKMFIVPNGAGKMIFEPTRYSFDLVFEKRCATEAMIDRLTAFAN